MKKIALSLGIIQSFVAVLAIPAGLSLLTTPDGSGLGVSREILQDSPFRDFFIPGLVLLIGNGLLNVVGALMAFANHKYTGIAGIALGLFLLVWISVQVYFVGLINFLQPLFFGIAVLEIALAIYYYYKVRSYEVKV